MMTKCVIFRLLGGSSLFFSLELTKTTCIFAPDHCPLAHTLSLYFLETGKILLLQLTWIIRFTRTMQTRRRNVAGILLLAPVSA